MERIVHFDLKGAPWGVRYFSKVISVVKQWGATGVLLEWEDTFPYTSDLTLIGSLGGCGREGLYSNDDIQFILQHVINAGLTPIQMIPSMGHMEFVLKHGKFRCLREHSWYPSVICPSIQESTTLIRSMVRQLLSVQKAAKYIHIGGDGHSQAYRAETKTCADCKQKSANHPHGEHGPFLDLITYVAKYVKNKHPGVSVMLYDNLLREIPETTLKAYKIGELVQLVVSNYKPVGAFNQNIQLWAKYKNVFPNVWAASAYKGANGSHQIIPSIEHYVSNQEAWIDELKVYEDEINFVGVIFTGISRVDHYAGLCELLPTALPTLASCLKMWTKPDDVAKDQIVSDTLPSADWPGEQLARCLQDFVEVKNKCYDFLYGEQLATWMNPWQKEHHFTSPFHIEKIIEQAKSLSSLLHVARHELSFFMEQAELGTRSADEWSGAVEELLAKVQRVAADAEDVRARGECVAPKATKRRSSCK